jgi:protein-S-isoprenylcysteine O-methyltransferase Ste14
MAALRTAIFVTWLAFWVYWLAAATRAKQGTHRKRLFPPGVRILLLAFIAIRVFSNNSSTVHTVALEIVGTAVFASGLGVAIWARINLGRNWGMPMTEKAEPELVTSGPYRFVRHPIYTGILLGLLGTALATDLYWLIPFAISAAYFIYSARVEEKILVSSFPKAYPSYRMRTKMLIPFVL